MFVVLVGVVAFVVGLLVGFLRVAGPTALVALFRGRHPPSDGSRENAS